jgi:hypothetical protein
VKMFQMYAESDWLAMVDRLVASSGEISRAALIERLIREEAEGRAVRVVPRLSVSKFDKWRRKCHSIRNETELPLAD